MTVNISFIRLKKNVIDNYNKSLKNFTEKAVEWDKLKYVLGDSRVQFTPVSYSNGVKKGINWNNDKQDMLVVDIDDSLSIPQCQAMFKKYKYLIGTTKSHRKDKKGLVCDRYRLCLPAINIPRDSSIYLRMISILFPFGDDQTETLTSAYLGNNDAIIIYNEGMRLDCFKASQLAKKQLDSEFVEKIIIDPDLINYSNHGNNIKDIKSQLTTEIIQDILESIGIEFNSIGKCKLRPEETTHSCKIYPNGFIKDFGGDISSDIFGVLMELENMTFVQSVNYVKQFI
jgi:hypothetical protein